MTLQEILIQSYEAGNIYHGFLDALIGAGASIIGGLFGSKKKKESQESITNSTNLVDFKELVRRSTDAGINPLTAIRGGAIGGFTKTRTYSKGTTTTSGGGASIGAAIADAGQQIAPLFGAGMQGKTDPIKLKSKTTGAITPLVSQQLRGSTLRAGSVVVAPRQSTVSSPRTNAAQEGRRIADYLEKGKLTNTDPWAWTGGWIEAAPYRVDGEQYETAYGDFTGSILGGTIPLGQDVYHNYGRAKNWAQSWWSDQVRASNYRVMARRPVVDNRRPPPAGYRYAN